MSGLVAAVHVVVLVGASDPDDALASAMKRAAAEALGDSAEIEVRRVATMPADDAAVELMGSARAFVDPSNLLNNGTPAAIQPAESETMR